ncbi:MAG: hypothetical protein NTW78_04110 [Campylobacterales bacterium]|nr:hypothetical protein [Campylobacterales bacterium]
MTLEELNHYNAKKRRPAYIAYKGVSESDMGKNGEHQGEHVAGVDLSEALQYAPHDENIFNGFKKVTMLHNPQISIPKHKRQINSKEKWRQWYQIYHPHPNTVHFSIVLHFFAADMDITFLSLPLEKFEQGTYYAFFSATLFDTSDLMPAMEKAMQTHPFALGIFYQHEHKTFEESLWHNEKISKPLYAQKHNAKKIQKHLEVSEIFLCLKLLSHL